MSKACCGKNKFPWWILIVSSVVAVLSTFLYWLIHSRRRMLNIEPYIQLETSEPTQKKQAANKTAVTQPSVDDLTILDGIGPKIQSVLQVAGLSSYQQLAATSADRLREITRAAGLRLADPTSWPKQAAFAAKNDMDGLAVFQVELQGSRRGHVSK